MIVNFKYIGIPVKGLNKEVQKIEIDDNANVDELLKKIVEQHDNIDLDYLKKCNFIVNNKNANITTVLKKGNTILIMKVLGGG